MAELTAESWPAPCIGCGGAHPMPTRNITYGAALLFAVATASISVACSSSETSVTTAPTAADRCQVTVSASPTSPFPAGGGSGSVNVTTARDCTWTVTTNANWVSLTGARDGQGNGTVAFTVAANSVPAARSGSITVASQQVQLSQAAAPCRFSLSRSSDSVGADGGRLSVDVTTLSGCSWTASSAASWIAVSSGRSGNASGTVGLTVSPNTGPARAGQVSIGGQTYSVSQTAAPVGGPDPTPPPNPPPPGTNVHLEGIAVVVDGGCPNVTFYLGLQRIVTDRSTDFSKGNCGDLRTGRGVEVDGVLVDGVVHAAKVRLQQG